MTASSNGKHGIVTALFSDAKSAERAYQACAEFGYEVGEVNAVLSEDTRRQLLSDDNEAAAQLASRKAEGGELGGPKGGRLSMLVTIFAAVGAALALPALGLVAAGPLAVALAGAGAAGLAGGLIGALGHWGIPQERFRDYEAGIRDGGILLTVETRSEQDARQIEKAWQAIGARHLYAC